MTASCLGHLLIVDDEIELMTVLCETLTDQGYETVGTASAETALTVLQQQDIDVLLSDLMMPEMDGIALLRAALDINPHLMGIIMTGQGTIQSAVDAMKIGAFDYILKPFKLQTLLPILGRALHVRQLRMENVQLRETVAIYELGQTIAYTLDIPVILDKVVDGAMQQVNGEAASIMLPRPNKSGEFFVAAIRGKEREALLGQSVPLTQSVTGWVAQHREPLTLHGAVNDLGLTAHASRDDITTLTLPMLAGGNLVGILSVQVARAQRPLTIGQVKALSILTNLAASALENAALCTQVRQSEERFRSVSDAAADAIISTDSHGTILSWNRGAQTLFGYSTDEIIGQSLTVLLPEQYRDVCTHGLHRVAAMEHQELLGKTIEARALRRDGSDYPVELSLASWQTTQGQFFSAIVRDITERKRLETQLHQARKMQAIGTLAGGIAHDFNNILMAILGYTELTIQDVDQSSIAWKNLQGVLTAGNRARDLVQQILAFSHQTETERFPVQMHLLVQEALTLLRAALPSTIAIQASLDPKTGSILADPTQMHQVVLNLCTNASHAMHDTGGLLEIRLDPVDVRADRSTPAPQLKAGPYTRLTVQDNGHGMTPEIMERIFEPFFTTKKSGQGTGMGLAVVHGIVSSHGGAITVESTPGQGSTFTVYLPRSERLPLAVVPEEPVIGGNARILFVDDEDALVHLGKAILERLGYHVTIYTSSLLALDALRATPHDFDLLITDRTMPKMTGEMLIREVRRIRPDIPVILCTGLSHTMTPEQLQALGIEAVVLKPVATRDWGLVVQRVLAQRTTPKT